MRMVLAEAYTFFRVICDYASLYNTVYFIFIFILQEYRKNILFFVIILFYTHFLTILSNSIYSYRLFLLVRLNTIKYY